VVKSFAKCLAHDGTLKRCVPLVPQRHTLLSHALNLYLSPIVPIAENISARYDVSLSEPDNSSPK
jgi:hypothetical protein